MSTMVTATATRLKPVGDRLAIKPTPLEEITRSGFVLPDAVRERPRRAQ